MRQIISENQTGPFPSGRRSFLNVKTSSMTRERLEQIFEETKSDSNWEGDNAFRGLQILSKYTDNLIQGAEHDIIYSCEIDDVVEKLTDEDATMLAKLNWMLHDGEYFACFV